MERAKVNQNINFEEYQDVWVIGECIGNKLHPVTVELIGEGRILADRLKKQLVVVMMGNDIEEEAKKLLTYNIDILYCINHPLLKNFSNDAYVKTVVDLIKEKKPEIVLVGATSIGRDIAPRIAARLGTGLTADCTKLEIDEKDQKLLMTRPAFGGNLMATIICPKNRPQMSTVRPGVMKKAVPSPLGKKSMVIVEPKLTKEDIRTEFIEFIPPTEHRVDLTEADIIVSGGRGLKSAENFSLIRELAEVLGGEVGSSRACVDAGWIDQAHQVGQTGTTVRPTLYIACGISGAVQHIAGMGESKFIVAINTDKNAPIFEICDYGVVGDLKEVIPAMIEEVKRNNKVEI